MLARGGAKPLLIERSRDPHDVVCGGFLAGDALGRLDRLGIDPAALGARPIHRVRLIGGGRIAETDLPFAAAGLSRHVLDAALLARAAVEGAAIERGIAIRRIDAVNRRLLLSDTSMIDADAIFLATGKYETRGSARSALPDPDPALGLRIRLDPTPALARDLGGMVELHLFARGYAGLLLLEDGGVNLCLSVAQSRLVAAGGQPGQLLASLAPEAPLLADRYGAAIPAGQWSTIARIPYGWRARQGRHGVFRLGDQAAVIASLAGDGIAIALASAIGAADAYLRHGAGAAPSFQTGFAARAHRPVAVANILRHWGERAWLAGPFAALLARAPALLRHAAAMTRIGEDQ